MKVWRNAIGSFALTLLILAGFTSSASAVKNFVTPFSNHGVVSGYGANGLTRLSRAFFSRGSVQDSTVYIVHNQQSFAVGRLDLYSNVQDTVKSLTVTEKCDAISNIDEVQIWIDTNGNGQWDPNSDTKVATSPAGLPFVGSGGPDSLALFTSFSTRIIIPANSHWKTAGGIPAATSASDSLSQADAHVSVFVVYKTAQQVSDCSLLRAGFVTGTSGVVLNSIFQDSTTGTGIFNLSAGAWLALAVENDSANVYPNGINLFAAGSYTVINAKQLGWLQLHYASPSLNALGQPAIDRASQNDTNVRILRFGIQSPDSCGTLNLKPAITYPSFGRIDTTVTGSISKGAQFDSLVYVTVKSENDNDGDVKTVKLWLKGWHDTLTVQPLLGGAILTYPAGTMFPNVGDSLEAGDTLIAAAGGTPGLSAFTAGNAVLSVGSGPGVGTFLSSFDANTNIPNFGTISGTVISNGNSRFKTSSPFGGVLRQRKYIVTYDINPVGTSHNTNRLDVQIPQFGIFFSRSGYMPSNNLAVDSAIVLFRALPFTVWIDTLATDRTLRANSTPDSSTNMHGLLVKGVIDIGDSTYNGGCSIANELAQLKVKNGSIDIDSLVVDLRAFGQGMKYHLSRNGWRPIGTDTVWSDTFSVRDPQAASLNDAFRNHYNGFSWDRYAADTYNRPTVTASNGNTGFLVAPDGPYSVATIGAINGMGFPKWYAYTHDINNVVQVDSGWAPTGFPGDGYAGPYTMVPVDSWLPPRPLNPQFTLADSGEVRVSVNKPYKVDSGNSAMGNNSPKNPGGGSVYIYAQANWRSGSPSGDINWSVPVDTITRTEWQGSFPGYMITPHPIRDIYRTDGQPANQPVHLNHNMDYLFGFRSRENGGNLELNKFVYSTVADTLAPSVSLVSPTRQCGIYGPDSENVVVNDSLIQENHHLFVYAVVDSSNGPDILNGSVQLHIRVKDIDVTTPGDQPGPWDDVNIQVNNGIGLPLAMNQIGDSYWFTSEIEAIFTSYNLQDEFELTVTSTDGHGNVETPDASYARENSLLQGGLNHLCFVWDTIQPVCELTLINGQETSSGVLPVIDLSNPNTVFTIRVTDAVNDRYGLPYFVRFNGDCGNNRGSIRGGAGNAAKKLSQPFSHFTTIGWLYPDANHNLTVNYPTSAIGGNYSIPGGATGTVCYTVQDSGGNSCEGSADFSVKDQTPPNANFVLPLLHTRLSLPYTIKVHATDNFGLGAAVLTLWNHATGAFMDTIAIVPRPGDASSVDNDYLYSYNWNKDRLYAIQVGMANGEEYDIHATVYDINNNTVTATTTFEYDGLAPTMKLEIVDPVVLNGHTVVSNGSTVTFKATPTGPFATDVTKVTFLWKRHSAPDNDGQYTTMGQVTSQFAGSYSISYYNFPNNDSVDVRVIAYDQSGNIAYDSDHDGHLDPGTIATAFASDPPSAVEFFTVSAPDYAIWKVTDLNTGLVYFPSPKLSGEDGGNVSCVYANSGDSLLINPSVNSTSGSDVMAEFWINGYGVGSNTFNNNYASVLLGRTSVRPYDFSFGLSSLRGLQEYVRVYGYWQGTITMKIYDSFGNIISTDNICLGVTNTGPSQACISEPTAGCVVWGDVDVCAVVVDDHEICKVRFEYKNLASGDWVPFDSVTSEESAKRAKAKIHAVKGGIQPSSGEFCGTWLTLGMGLPDGEYALRAVAISCTGVADPSPLNITVKLDNQGPSVALGPIPDWVGGGNGWTNPVTGNTLFQTLPLSATVTRSVAKVNHVTWQVRLSTDSPGSWSNLATDYTNPWAWNYIFNPGNQAFWENNFGNNCDVVFRACMTDEACPPRTVYSGDSTAKVDFTSPSCHFMTVNGTPVTNIPVDVTAGVNVPLVAFAADDEPTTAVNVGLDSVEFKVYGNTGIKIFDLAQAAGDNTNFTALWNTTGLTAGDYYVYFYAWDKLNNYCSSSTTVHVSDLAAPVASIGAITCTKIAAISYDRDVNDVTIQMRAAGASAWTNVGISTQIFKGSLNAKQAKMMGRNIAKKLHNGNVPFTLWTTTYDGSALTRGNYEFRAVANDTAANSNPSLAPVATATVGGGNCTVTPVDLPAIQQISFLANETTCDSALVQVTTDGTVSVPAVVVVQQTLNQDAVNSTVDVVAMHTNSINSSTFFGSLDISRLDPGGNAWVFAGGDNGLVTDLEYNGLTIFSVTPSLGSNSTISSVDSYLSAYFPPASVYYPIHVILLPTDMPQPQPDDHRIRGVPNPGGTIECIDYCNDENGTGGQINKTRINTKPTAKTQGTEGYYYDFAKPVKINLKYGTPVGANSAARLSVARWTGSEWDLVTGISQVSVDPSTNTASAWVQNSGCYAVVELDESCSPGTLTITDVRALPGQAAGGAALQVPVNGYVNPRPCFSALINDQFNNNNIENVEVWLRPVGGHNIKLMDYKTSFLHCGLDQAGNGDPGYEIGSGWMNICYEDVESEGCHDGIGDDGGSDDGEFPAIKQGNYVLTVKATSKLGYCQTAEQEFNVDATGPTVTNLTPTYQGNNPVIIYSARDDGAGLSTKWQAVDLFVQEFDRDNTTIKAPIYKGTFYLNNGITSDSSKTDEAGHTTRYYSVKTHFDMKEQDHLRAVVYGGRDGDWFNEQQYYETGPARQYIANGGVRDSLDNAAGPLEVNTTIRTAILPGSGTVDFTPGSGTTPTCVGPNATFTWTLTGDQDKSSLSIVYTNATSGAVLATRHLSDVTWTGNTVVDQPNLNLTGVTSVAVTFSVTDNNEPRGTLTKTNNFTVDLTPPTFGTPTFAGGDFKVAITDVGCGGIEGDDITVKVNNVTHSASFVDGILTVPGLTPGDQVAIHACDGVYNCADGNFIMESSTLGFGSGLGAPHNYPNPFDNKADNTTTIVLGITRTSTVEMRIFDLGGHLVKEYPARSAGPASTLVWDGRDDNGREVARGVYLGQIKATDGSRTASAVIKIAVAR